ncbi:MAG: Ig-like domain-containing protein, partial [Betaproteobacteria bacterium]
DVENDNLTFTIVSDVSNGTTSLSGATVTYTPDSNWNGTDTFTFKANDGTDDSNTSTVTITVNPVNDAPVTRDIPQEQKLNTSAIVDLSTQTTDIDNDTLIFSIVSNVSNGTTSIDGSIVTYTPNANFTGIDSYTYKANDGTDDSNTSTVTITVLPPSAPVAYDISSSVDEDWTGHTIKIVGDNTGGSDADGDALTYIIVSLPSNGNIYNDLGGGIPDGDALAVGDILTSNNTIYNPTANYNGTDSFTFKVNDGLLDSNIATVTITVNPVNDAPITWDVATTIDENRVMQGRLVGITLVGDDVDGDDLTYSLVTNPENGTATISGSRLTYTANQDWNGVETFTYKANDGTVDSNTSTVTVTVNPVNDTPVVIGGAGQGNLSMKFDASLVESGNTNDGYIQFPANTFDFGGEWTISFWYKDGGVTSGVQRIFSRGYTERDPHEGSSGNAAFGIGFLNDGGYARNLEFHARETFGEAAYSSSTIDVSDGWQHYVIVRNNSSMDLYINSSLDGFNETFGVIADNDYQTTDFINRIGSGALTLDDNGLITGWIDDFVIWNNSLNTSQISSLYNNGNGGVDPSTVLDWVIVHYSFDGETISGNTISDQSGNGNHATFTNVQGALSASSDVPFGIGGCTDCAPDTTIVTEEDTAGSIDLSSLVSDVDGDTLTYSIVTDVTNGTTSLSGSIVTYTPAANYNGSDSFTWKVNDGTVDSAAGKVYITVNAVNDTPVTSNQTASTDEDTVVEITLSSTDAESDTVTYSIVSDASNGSTSLSGSTVTYNPDENYNGTDSFTFKGNDGTDDGNTSTVTITVNPVNDGGPTVENSRQLEYFELNTTSSFSLSAQDEDGDELTYYISEEPTSGTVTIDGSSVQYTPNTGLSTFDSFKWYASDGQYNTNEVTVRMRFKPQFTFENTFSNGRDDEKAFAIEKTSDGGAILVGYSKTLIFNNADIYVVKVDSNGNKEWSNTYDYMGGNDWGGDIKELSSGNYLIAGSVNANSSGSSGDLYLLTINSIGEKVSDVIPFKVGFDNSIAYVDTPQNMFNGIENFRGNIDLDVAQDGNYIVSTRGGTHMFNSSTGQMIWEFNHALSGGAIQNSDGTIADLQFYSNPILTGLNQDGETLWSTSLGSSNTEYTWSLEATNDNGYIVTGWTTNLGAYLKDVYLTKINSSGSIVWNKAFYFDIEETTYGNLNDVGYKAIQLDSDNYLISAGDYLYKSDDTSNNGQESKIWERQLTSSYIYDLEELSSGVLFGAGYSIDGDMYLFRIDE